MTERSTDKFVSSALYIVAHNGFCFGDTISCEDCPCGVAMPMYIKRVGDSPPDGVTMHKCTAILNDNIKLTLACNYLATVDQAQLDNALTDMIADRL